MAESREVVASLEGQVSAKQHELAELRAQLRKHKDVLRGQLKELALLVGPAVGSSESASSLTVRPRDAPVRLSVDWAQGGGTASKRSRTSRNSHAAGGRAKTAKSAKRRPPAQPVVVPTDPIPTSWPQVVSELQKDSPRASFWNLDRTSARGLLPTTGSLSRVRRSKTTHCLQAVEDSYKHADLPITTKILPSSSLGCW